MTRFWAGLAALGLLLLPAQARAEATEIRIARQFSLGYLQFAVIEHQGLIEKHAKALGLPDVKVTWQTFNGPSSMNDALLSGSTDIVSGGMPGLLTLWNRSRGTSAEVRGVAALSSQPFFLNTRRPEVKTIADLGDGDRIAVPSIKVSIQAVVLQMAAAKLWGDAEYARLDKLTVSLSPPDATVALLAGTDITCAFSVPPFQYQELENPAIHRVLSSFDVMGPHSFTVAWTSKRFHDANPTLYKALLAALREATEIVNRDRRTAAALWLVDSRSKLPLDKVVEIVSGPEVTWTTVPQNTMGFASFMHRVGTLKVQPASWKDYFFSEIHDQPGS